MGKWSMGRWVGGSVVGGSVIGGFNKISFLGGCKKEATL